MIIIEIVVFTSVGYETEEARTTVTWIQSRTRDINFQQSKFSSLIITELYEYFPLHAGTT